MRIFHNFQRNFRPPLYSFRTIFMSTHVTMARSIELTDTEATLRDLLLDVSSFISRTQRCPKPELRFTGGWVRDKLLGTSSHDIDISISSMTGREFADLMKKGFNSSQIKSNHGPDIIGSLANIPANPEKSKHLETVTTKILGFEVDLVNLRKETYCDDSRNPTIEHGTPEEDAFRRDSTVNALFYNLQTGDVEDFTGRGLEDLEAGLIKTPLDPYQTFKDDPLRILRSIRFASRLGFRIDQGDEQAMSDKINQEALRLKISRERFGVEITKMLKGPDPHEALNLIDRLKLYNTIFTNPKSDTFECVSTENWHLAYDTLRDLAKVDPEDKGKSNHVHAIAANLLRNPEDVYLAWAVCCFVPWARVKIPAPTSKNCMTLGAVAAREGIKADNKLSKVIGDAGVELENVIKMKDSVVCQAASSRTALKRKDQSSTREIQGKALRRWGPRWRSIAIYALLVEVSNVKNDSERQLIFRDYASWLSELSSLDLLDIYLLKPLVDGSEIAAALDAQNGPWLKKALEMCIEWQLRNPDETEKGVCLEEIISRKKELGLA